MNLAQHYFDEAAKNGHSNAQYEERHMQRQNEDKKNNNESVMQPEGTLLKLPQPQEIDESP
jgi:TPR repeat protein